jgi:hypothetical protein
VAAVCWLVVARRGATEEAASQAGRGRSSPTPTLPVRLGTACELESSPRGMRRARAGAMLFSNLKTWSPRTAAATRTACCRPASAAACVGGGCLLGALGRAVCAGEDDEKSPTQPSRNVAASAREESMGAVDDGDTDEDAPTRNDAARPIPLLARIGKVFAVKKVALAKVKAA